jgi:hypothetical protein
VACSAQLANLNCSWLQFEAWRFLPKPTAYIEHSSVHHGIKRVFEAHVPSFWLSIKSKHGWLYPTARRSSRVSTT